MMGHVALMGKVRNAHRNLVGKYERKRPLEGPRNGWVYHIKIYVTEIGDEVVGCCYMARNDDK
jgi:hypothetical protein